MLERIFAKVACEAATMPEAITVKKAGAMLRDAGLPAGANVKRLIDQVDAICDKRAARAKRRAAMPTASLAQRLVARKAKRARIELEKKKQLVIDAVNLRYGAAGGTNWYVSFTDDPAAVGYHVDIDSCRDVYRGRFKGWSAAIDNHNIVVPVDWVERVYANRLAAIGGMFTLDARFVENVGGVDLYAAVWAEQSRGYSVSVSRGFIARALKDGKRFNFHGRTRASALAGVARKIGATEAIAAAEKLARLSAAEFCAKFAGAHFDVTVADAQTTGSCLFGIRSWCEATGLDFSAGSASIAQVIEAYRARPMPEARLAILYAARKNKRLNAIVETPIAAQPQQMA